MHSRPDNQIRAAHNRAYLREVLRNFQVHLPSELASQLSHCRHVVVPPVPRVDLRPDHMSQQRHAPSNCQQSSYQLPHCLHIQSRIHVRIDAAKQTRNINQHVMVAACLPGLRKGEHDVGEPGLSCNAELIGRFDAGRVASKNGLSLLRPEASKEPASCRIERPDGLRHQYKRPPHTLRCPLRIDNLTQTSQTIVVCEAVACPGVQDYIKPTEPRGDGTPSEFENISQKHSSRQAGAV